MSLTVIEPVLQAEFYARPVLDVARELIGCTLMHNGVGGVIVETEAYHQDEPACHAFGGPTPRSKTLFAAPGTAYVYLSYGVHSLLNAVSEPEDVGAAVLVRALDPTHGKATMAANRGHSRLHEFCSGPGKLTQALGIGLDSNESSLEVGPVNIHARPRSFNGSDIVRSQRIGITRAVDLLWRFHAAGNKNVSRPR